MSATFDWRAHLKVHPAADLFPMLSAEELQELADDIQTNGLRSAIHLRKLDDDEYEVIDGRNRLDALAKLGLLGIDQQSGRLIVTKSFNPKDKWTAPSMGLPSQPFAYATSQDIPALVRSLNIHRRHLNVDQRREVIVKLLKLDPTKSDRTIAKELKRDHKTIGKVRAKLEEGGELLPTSKRTGLDGKEQPAKKAAVAEPQPEPEPEPVDDEDDETSGELALFNEDVAHLLMWIDDEDAEARGGFNYAETDHTAANLMRISKFFADLAKAVK